MCTYSTQSGTFALLWQLVCCAFQPNFLGPLRVRRGNAFRAHPWNAPATAAADNDTQQAPPDGDNSERFCLCLLLLLFCLFFSSSPANNAQRHGRSGASVFCGHFFRPTLNEIPPIFLESRPASWGSLSALSPFADPSSERASFGAAEAQAGFLQPSTLPPTHPQLARQCRRKNTSGRPADLTPLVLHSWLSWTRAGRFRRNGRTRS